ncbi:MAG: cytochrome o ubiquinol oxidase subunit III [Oligoflexia bacterium]|nr:cytochrome o ubiquinol oxidase subunit III [Oligoflexia bacterium]
MKDNLNLNLNVNVKVNATGEVAEEEDIKAFGFWIYLMTDLIIFAVLFATFCVLRNSTFGGPSGRELFHMPSVLAETLALLISSFTCSLAMIEVHQQRKIPAIAWFAVTFILGAIFLSLEVSEFFELIDKGNNWQRSAFLSSFFTLVATHGLHIFIGLLWMICAMFRIWFRPFSAFHISNLFRLALFWHFLDLVWIFIFTVVYGMGHLL